jgi:hypothetical protein
MLYLRTPAAFGMVVALGAGKVAANVDQQTPPNVATFTAFGDACRTYNTSNRKVA